MSRVSKKQVKHVVLKHILFLFRFCLVLIQWHYSKCVTRWHCQALGCSCRKLHQNYWGWTRGRTLVLCFSASKQQYVYCILFVQIFFYDNFKSINCLRWFHKFQENQFKLQLYTRTWHWIWRLKYAILNLVLMCFLWFS